MSKNKPAPAATDTNTLIEAKLENLKQLEARGVNPYPYKCEVTHHAGALQEKYADLAAGEVTEETVAVAGRVMSHRNSGMFIDLHARPGKNPIFCHKGFLPAQALAAVR